MSVPQETDLSIHIRNVRPLIEEIICSQNNHLVFDLKHCLKEVLTEKDIDEPYIEYIYNNSKNAKYLYRLKGRVNCHLSNSLLEIAFQQIECLLAKHETVADYGIPSDDEQHDALMCKVTLLKDVITHHFRFPLDLIGDLRHYRNMLKCKSGIESMLKEEAKSLDDYRKMQLDTILNYVDKDALSFMWTKISIRIACIY